MQRMVEANMRQHGQKTLGAPIGEASIARIKSKFLELGEGVEETKSAVGWGRVGLAVIAALDVEDAEELEAVVTMRKNGEVEVTVTGFRLPAARWAEGVTSGFAEQIATEVREVLPENEMLNKDEFGFYLAKAKEIGEVRWQFERPNALAVFATAKDFSEVVTMLPLLEKGTKPPVTLKFASPDKTVSVSRRARSKRTYGSTASIEESVTSFEHLPGNDASKQSTSFHTPLSERLDTTWRLRARPSIPSKRTFTASELDDDEKDAPSTKNHRPSGEPRRSHLAPSTTAPSHTATDRGAYQLSSNSKPSSASSSLVRTKKPTKKPTKPTPTRQQILEDWRTNNMTHYTVPQLRAYLKQENLMGDLKYTATRDGLMRRIRETEEAERVYPQVQRVERRKELGGRG